MYFWGLLCELNELMHVKCLNSACSYLNSKGAKKVSHYDVHSSLLMYRMLLNECNMASLFSCLWTFGLFAVWNNRTQYCFKCSSFYTLYKFLCAKYVDLEIELLSCRLCLCSATLDNASLFIKIIVPVCISASSVCITIAPYPCQH